MKKTLLFSLIVLLSGCAGMEEKKTISFEQQMVVRDNLAIQMNMCADILLNDPTIKLADDILRISKCESMFYLMRMVTQYPMSNAESQRYGRERPYLLDRVLRAKSKLVQTGIIMKQRNIMK